MTNFGKSTTKRPTTATATCDDVAGRLDDLARRVRRLEKQAHASSGAVLAVACPWCGAEPGHVCREPSETATTPHKARTRAWFALRELAPLAGLGRG